MKSHIKKKIVTNILTSLNRELSTSDVVIDNNKLRAEFLTIIDDAGNDNQDSQTKIVCILLSDLRGFTAMSEVHSAANLMKLLNRYFSKMSEIIFRHNGTIDKFMGDSIMALFGAPVSQPDDLQRAITCAIEMQLAMEEINEGNRNLGFDEIFMGIGINIGEVVAGNLGSVLHSEYTVIGDEVNLTSRVESHSLRGQVLLSENAYLLAKDYIEIGNVNEVFVKGKKNIVLMYEILSTSKPNKLVVPKREIRRSPRVEVDMPINFYIVDGKSILPEERTGKIIDMSYGGLMIKTPFALKVHSQIKFVLSLSLMGHRNSEVYATLLSVNEGEDEFKSQLEFTAIEPEAKRELKEFIDSVVENT